jgi:hypothetical protein
MVVNERSTAITTVISNREKPLRFEDRRGGAVFLVGGDDKLPRIAPGNIT